MCVVEEGRNVDRVIQWAVWEGEGAAVWLVGRGNEWFVRGGENLDCKIDEGDQMKRNKIWFTIASAALYCILYTK